MPNITYEEFLAHVKNGGSTACSSCPLKSLCLKLQGKWKLQICFALCAKEKLRFSELKQQLPGINNSVLAATLREMEADGLIRREQFNEMPLRVEYSPTDMGQDLLPIFYQMMVWGLKYNDKAED